MQMQLKLSKYSRPICIVNKIILKLFLLNFIINFFLIIYEKFFLIKKKVNYQLLSIIYCKILFFYLKNFFLQVFYAKKNFGGKI